MDSKNKSKKTVLILGSGMMVEPLIDILLKRPENYITIATNMIKAFNVIAQKRKGSNLTGIELDVVNNESQLDNLVQKSDVVISF